MHILQPVIHLFFFSIFKHEKKRRYVLSFGMEVDVFFSMFLAPVTTCFGFPTYLLFPLLPCRGKSFVIYAMITMARQLQMVGQGQ